jgi:hypothetical protein
VWCTGELFFYEEPTQNSVKQSQAAAWTWHIKGSIPWALLQFVLYFARVMLWWNTEWCYPPHMHATGKKVPNVLIPEQYIQTTTELDTLFTHLHTLFRLCTFCSHVYHYVLIRRQPNTLFVLYHICTVWFGIAWAVPRFRTHWHSLFQYWRVWSDCPNIVQEYVLVWTVCFLHT